MKRFLLLALCLGLVGCATTPSIGKKSTMLRIGMTKAEVTEILGNPKTTSVKEKSDGVVEKWSYWSKMFYGTMVLDDPNMAGSGNRITVTFKNELVSSWGDQLDYSNMMENSIEAMSEYMKNMPTIHVEQKVYDGDKLDAKEKE